MLPLRRGGCCWNPAPVTGPREWRHADGCGLTEVWADRCYCGLDAFRDAIAGGHRVVIGRDGVEGRLKRWVDGSHSVVPLEELES